MMIRRIQIVLVSCLLCVGCLGVMSEGVYAATMESVIRMPEIKDDNDRYTQFCKLFFEDIDSLDKRDADDIHYAITFMSYCHARNYEGDAVNIDKVFEKDFIFRSIRKIYETVCETVNSTDIKLKLGHILRIADAFREKRPDYWTDFQQIVFSRGLFRDNQELLDALGS